MACLTFSIFSFYLRPELNCSKDRRACVCFPSWIIHYFRQHLSQFPSTRHIPDAFNEIFQFILGLGDIADLIYKNILHIILERNLKIVVHFNKMQNLTSFFLFFCAFIMQLPLVSCSLLKTIFHMS